MRFMIGVDCEGVACGVGSPGGGLNDSKNLAWCQRQATREANAAAQALFDAGATQVIVWDNHAGSLNLDYDALDRRCDIALGVGFPHRWPGLESGFAGVLFIGYHAADNTVAANMAHTYSSAAHQWIKVNGTEVGELAIDAAMAGRLDVPPIFVASDDKAVAEAEDFFPEIETVQTKRAFGWNAAVSKHPQRVCDEIRGGVAHAVQRLKDFRPFRFSEPLSLEIRYKRIEAAEAATRGHRGGDRTDPFTVRWDLARLEDWF